MTSSFRGVPAHSDFCFALWPLLAPPCQAPALARSRSPEKVVWDLLAQCTPPARPALSRPPTVLASSLLPLFDPLFPRTLLFTLLAPCSPSFFLSSQQGTLGSGQSLCCLLLPLRVPPGASAVPECRTKGWAESCLGCLLKHLYEAWPFPLVKILLWRAKRWGPWVRAGFLRLGTIDVHGRSLCSRGHRVHRMQTG